MSLWLVRHGRPVVEPGVCYGALDLAADPGHTLEAARALASQLPRGAPVRCSPLQRCEHLMTALCALRADLTFETDPRLVEMDFGDWEGRRWDAIGCAALDAWTADFAQHRPGGGESVAQFMQRVGAAFDEAGATGQTHIWITHAGVIRAARLLAAGVRLPKSADQWPAESVDFGGCTSLTLQGFRPA
jgi:alpha-ribazole phosphatase